MFSYNWPTGGFLRQVPLYYYLFQFGHNLLHAAATGGNLELVQLLIADHKLVPADTKVNGCTLRLYYM